MFSWLKKSASEWTTAKMEDDLTAFIKVLRGMESTAIGSLLVGAAHARVSMTKRGDLPHHILTDGPAVNISECNSAALLMNRIIQKRQIEELNTIASFIMVWLHTIRSLGTLELMPLSKEMWRELSRGLPHLNEGKKTVDSIFEQMGGKVDDTVLVEALFIPTPFDELIEFSNVQDYRNSLEQKSADKKFSKTDEENHKLTEQLVKFIEEINNNILGKSEKSAVGFVQVRLSNWEQNFDGVDLNVTDRNCKITASVDPATNSFDRVSFIFTNKIDASVLHIRSTVSPNSSIMNWSGKISLDDSPKAETLNFYKHMKQKCLEKFNLEFS